MDLDANPIVLKIRNGTSRSDENLCVTCDRYIYRKEAQTGKEVRICQASYEVPMYLTGPVAVCNRYEDRRQPSLYDMRKIAWDVKATSSGKVLGFTPPKKEDDF